MADAQAAAAGASATGKRPGGLTALAVLNFVFGGLGLIFSIIGIIGVGAMMAMAAGAAKALGGSAAMAAMPSAAVLYGQLGIGLLASILEIVAGIGYLGQKKSGRTMGNAFAILGVVSVIMSIVLVHSGFGFSAILGLVWPGLTLFFINTTYKNNLVN